MQPTSPLRLMQPTSPLHLGPVNGPLLVNGLVPAFDLWPTPGPWLALVLLGAYHGVNPGMGWLFAVALGLQNRSRGAVLRALGPIALGHLIAVAVTVLLVRGVGLVTAPEMLRPVGAGVLIAFGLYKLLKPGSHPRWVGMRVGPWELVWWSFLMSTAHGAGLMLFPILVGPAAAMDGTPGVPEVPGMSAADHIHGHTAAGGLTGATAVQDLAAVLVHTAAMLIVMGAVALLVFEKLGLSVLRRAWVNFDVLWAVAVIVVGVFTLVT
jgi:hypothetical protein